MTDAGAPAVPGWGAPGRPQRRPGPGPARTPTPTPEPAAPVPRRAHSDLQVAVSCCLAALWARTVISTVRIQTACVQLSKFSQSRGYCRVGRRGHGQHPGALLGPSGSLRSLRPTHNLPGISVPNATPFPAGQPLLSDFLPRLGILPSPQPGEHLVRILDTQLVPSSNKYILHFLQFFLIVSDQPWGSAPLPGAASPLPGAGGPRGLPQGEEGAKFTVSPVPPRISDP